MFDPSDWDYWRDHSHIKKLSGDRYLIRTKSKSIYLAKGDIIIVKDGDVFLAEEGLLDLSEPSQSRSKE